MITCSKWVLLYNYVCVIPLICLLNFQIRWWVCTCVSICGTRSNLTYLSFSCMLHFANIRSLRCVYWMVFCWNEYMDQRYPLLFLSACSIAYISGYVSYLTYVEIIMLILLSFCSLHYQFTAGELYCMMWMWPMFSLFLCWNFIPLPTVGGEFTEWFVNCMCECMIRGNLFYVCTLH